MIFQSCDDDRLVFFLMSFRIIYSHRDSTINGKMTLVAYVYLGQGGGVVG